MKQDKSSENTKKTKKNNVRTDAEEKRAKLMKQKKAAEFKRKYFDLYDDVKISYKEDW